MTPAIKIFSILLFSAGLLRLSIEDGHAQEIVEEVISEFIAPADSLPQSVSTAADSLTQAVLIKANSTFQPVMSLSEKSFKPNSTKAVLLSFIPGMGQIYNRKYWKLPIVYGGLMACMYAINWNGKNYQDYWSAYKAIVHDSEEYTHLQQQAGGGEVDYTFSKEWTDFMSSNQDLKSIVNNTSYHNLFKSRKDFFRRNRDLSYILTVGVYLICMVDAYVDAELFDFDISPDLSFRVEPMVTPRTRFSQQSVGINCSITF
jgi:hypothetical protein